MHKRIGLSIVCSTFTLAAMEDIGRFDTSQTTLPAAWKSVRFDTRIPETRYRLLDWEGVAAIEASAEASMSLLMRAVTIDLQKTPILCWRWRVDAPVATADMRNKSGDDYAARVYLGLQLPESAISLGHRMKLELARNVYSGHLPDVAINYVWDNVHPIGTEHPNAYTDRTQMIVLRSGAGEARHWVTERRNVLQDAQRSFHHIPLQATSLAIASDTDNTRSSARAGFADLHFVQTDAPCRFTPIKPAP